jgi:hypothetical protein
MDLHNKKLNELYIAQTFFNASTLLKWYKYDFNIDIVHERVSFIFRPCNIKIHANSTEENTKETIDLWQRWE